MLEAGTRLGVYESLASVGAGGMGEVYRARDTALNRDVAIKVLPAAFPADPDRVARFEREAQLLAAVNHPHIATIYGVERAGGAQFLVLEFVDGETLAGKLQARGGRPLDLDEARAIARQIANALQAAHDKGIVHRDLKPANIAVTHDGVVTFAATQAGIILGTAAYMSPEQAKGKATDKRTDVWAFGCVLFEMLTGRRAFDGDDVTETIAAIIRGDPDWHALPQRTSDPVRLLLHRCPTKDRQARIADIGAATFVLSEPSLVTPRRAGVTPAAVSRGRLVAAFVAAAVASAVAAAAIWAIASRRPAAPSRASRFIIEPPAPQRLSVSGADPNVDVSADGSLIVDRVVTQSNYQLFVRPIDGLESRPLPIGTDAREPVTHVNGQIEFGRGAPVLSTRYVAGSTGLGLDLRGYDLSPDGTRFLFVKEPAPDPAETQRETGIVVVANWTRALNGRGARR
jgi:eukaryotic-like serine/threonine-protein kinase